MDEFLSALEAIAFHEAGHAVIALALGIPVGKVSIERNGSRLGLTEVWLDHSGCHHLWKARGRVRPPHYAIDARVMVLMAGAITEQHLLFEERGGDGSDMAQVDRLIPHFPVLDPSDGRSACCARAATGHAGTLTSPPMNCRRLIRSPRWRWPIAFPGG
jgi:hypothetical protein